MVIILVWVVCFVSLWRFLISYLLSCGIFIGSVRVCVSFRRFLRFFLRVDCGMSLVLVRIWVVVVLNGITYLVLSIIRVVNCFFIGFTHCRYCRVCTVRRIVVDFTIFGCLCLICSILIRVQGIVRVGCIFVRCRVWVWRFSTVVHRIRICWIFWPNFVLSIVILVRVWIIFRRFFSSGFFVFL